MRDNNDNIVEKKAIIYLIILALILLYIALFAVHDIVDKGVDNKNDIINNPVNITDNNSIDNKGDNYNNTNNGQKQQPQVIDYSDRIKVNQINKKDGTKVNFKDVKDLDIFRNNFYDYNDESIIAPGINGEYKFTVENENPVKFLYNISFTEDNKYNINLRFKVKLNGEYILGNESTWANSANLQETELVLKENAIDIFTIEWEWPYEGNDEKDTKIGKTDGAIYNIKIKFDAEQIIN